ncbi:MAG TPA: sigma-70 family RNA polymerase sigma factor [Solirubrobacterales bacterium]|nr:sigma-70 family RNA polymerase sigma factor [Solirubrobacterales bacterium]
MEAGTKQHEVTAEELREAEKGLERLLHAKRFPREWIERNLPDVMAQARSELAARIAAGKEDDTVNLLVVIGYRRATKVLDMQLSRPQSTSLEKVVELVDEATPTPEDEAIDHDRQQRVVQAMGQLSERERKLLALVYFDNKSVREAGRRLGWGKSSADRHHRAALDRLHKLLDRSLLSPEVAIPAYAAARHWQASPVRAAERWVRGAGETVADGLMMSGGKYAHAAEAATAATAGGAGRTAAGICGAAMAAVCLTSGLVGPGIDGLDLIKDGSKHREDAHRVSGPSPRIAGSAAVNVTPFPLTEHARSSSPDQSDDQGTSSETQGVNKLTADSGFQRRSRAPVAETAAHQATPVQTVTEFGVERGEANNTHEPTETAGIPAPAESPRSSARPSVDAPLVPSAARTIPSDGRSGSSEFGM